VTEGFSNKLPECQLLPSIEFRWAIYILDKRGAQVRYFLGASMAAMTSYRGTLFEDLRRPRTPLTPLFQPFACCRGSRCQCRAK